MATKKSMLGRISQQQQFPVVFADLKGFRYRLLRGIKRRYWEMLSVFAGYISKEVAVAQQESRQKSERIVELEETLERLSLDDLTGVPSRKAFTDRLGSEISRVEREVGMSFCLAILDIDHFKGVNDTYGHQAGDETLRAFAELVCQRPLRKSDFFARIGGEEFAMIFPSTRKEGAYKLMNRIRGLVEKSLSIVLRDGQVIRITVSIGIAEWIGGPSVASRGRGESLVELFERADKALYTAKRSGRNRVVIAQ